VEGRKSPSPIDLAHGLYNSLYYRTSRDIYIHYDYICSDQKPLSVCLKNVVPKMCVVSGSDTSAL